MARGRREPGDIQLELAGLESGEERPRIALQVLDHQGKVIHSQEIGAEGTFSLSADARKNADRVIIGAPDEQGAPIAETASVFRGREFIESIANDTLAIAEGIWKRWPPIFFTCVSGQVKVCRRRPWWFDAVFTRATEALSARKFGSPALSRVIEDQAVFKPSLPALIAWPFRCETVCLGTVEVFRRTCCCWPIILDDPRISDLIRDLSHFVEVLPKFPPRPPGPDPAPVDPLKTPFFNGGAINDFALNATADLDALTTLRGYDALHYVNDRPYLIGRICSCGSPSKVGTGTIQPDGTFNICWRDFPRFLRPGCSDSFAYVVKQTIGGTTTTIYDGVAAGAWYSGSDSPELMSYDPRAFTCGETGTAPGDSVIYLDLIGDTESHELTTPDSTGWDRVQTPTTMSGLLFPNPVPSGHLRNLGGSIELTYLFSEQCKDPAIDARYYRVSVSPADSSGNPTGTRTYFGDGLAWQKVVGGDIVPETLGPFTIGTESNLYKIPYASDANWTGAGRYHALINTSKPEFNVPDSTDIAAPASNHLVTLEVFNNAGERIRPLGTPASGQPGTEVTKAFEFRRWFQPGGSVGDDTENVPFAALTHLFCWDNRAPVADITRLVFNGIASDEECQFLVGSALSTFGIEYRAYVPDERFQLEHTIGWIRGLNGSTANGGVGTLPTVSPLNVGKPPSSPANSGTNTFHDMLRRIDPVTHVVTELTRCSFAVTLTTRSKTTNGEDFNYPYAQEVAAFALEIPSIGIGG